MNEGHASFSFWIESPNLRRGGILKRYSRQHPAQSYNTIEFDVVKKRRAMDSESPSAEDSPDALASFEDFERSVLSALELIRDDDNNNRRLELQDFEDSVSKGILPTTSGGVYFAWSTCLDCMKIGATRRDDPSIRLHELSRHVTVPFTLVGWIPTPTPFRLESVAHAHFAGMRIRNAGAGTEFFKIDAGIVEEWCMMHSE
jgi:hypothetical protein